MKIAVIFPPMVYNRDMNKFKQPQIDKICELFEEGTMLKDIVKKVNSNKDTVRKYLNERFGHEYVRQKTIENFRQRYKTGESNHFWKGGKEILNTGYIRLYRGLDNNRRKIRISEHRYVMEQHLGRKLTNNEQVHHINSKRDDNRLENLQLMTTAEHIRFHNLTKIPLMPRDAKGRFIK